MPECYLCGGEVSEADFCWGCNEYVCQNCDDDGDFPIGDHKPEDHEK